MKLTDIELLAAPENLRIIHANDKPQNNDWILRVASAIVAHNCGYNDRATWTAQLRENGLVKYGLWEDAEQAKEIYKNLMEKLDKEDGNE